MFHEFYDWSTLIDKDARQRMHDEVHSLIFEQGKYWTNSPKYQTNKNVMKLPGCDWMNLKMSFIWSCFAYLQKEVQIKNIQSWSYMTSLKKEENRDILWHHHNHDPNTKTVSGVFYIHLPDDVKDLTTAGTELAPNGPGNEGCYFVPFKEGHWMIYNGAMYHRPGILQSHDYRCIVAADMEF